MLQICLLFFQWPTWGTVIKRRRVEKGLPSIIMKMKNMGNSHSMPSKSWRKTQRDRDRKLVFESSRGVKSVALGMEGRFHGQASAPFFPHFESYSLFWGWLEWLEVFDELLIREKGSSKLWKQRVLLIFSVQKHSPVSKLIFLQQSSNLSEKNYGVFGP